MNSQIIEFWNWFNGFSKRLPDGDPLEVMLDELLDRLHVIDDRVYFELATNTQPKELILTAQGDVDIFPVVDEIVAAAPKLREWSFIALKPPMGFDFTFQNNGIALKASELWFRPLESKSDPNALGVCLGVPDVDLLFGRQTVDAAYTILETGIGERSCATDIQHITVDDLPENPEANGYRPLPGLAKYVAWHESKHSR